MSSQRPSFFAQAYLQNLLPPRLLHPADGGVATLHDNRRDQFPAPTAADLLRHHQHHLEHPPRGSTTKQNEGTLHKTCTCVRFLAPLPCSMYIVSAIGSIRCFQPDGHLPEAVKTTCIVLVLVHCSLCPTILMPKGARALHQKHCAHREGSAHRTTETRQVDRDEVCQCHTTVQETLQAISRKYRHCVQLTSAALMVTEYRSKALSSPGCRNKSSGQRRR